MAALRFAVLAWVSAAELQVQRKPPSAACPYDIPKHSALMVIDMQNDFIADWGSLQVTGAAEIIPLINNLSSCEWAVKVFTQDFHPSNHVSFASTSVDNVPAFGFANLTYAGMREDRAKTNPVLCGKKYSDAGTWGHSAQESCGPTETSLYQQLWPDHCIQGTAGMEFDDRVNISADAVISYKGFSSVVDSYGALYNNLNISESKLGPLFTLAGIKEVYVVGLAYDYCVKHTSIQSSMLGFKTTVFRDVSRAVHPDDNDETTQELEAAGVAVGLSSMLLAEK